jgi:hypothetical protein
MFVCTGAPTNTASVGLTTTVGAGVTYTFSLIGESLTILWTGSAWVPLAFGGNALATDPGTGGSPGGLIIT